MWAGTAFTDRDCGEENMNARIEFWRLWEQSQKLPPEDPDWITIDELLEEDEKGEEHGVFQNVPVLQFKP